VATSVPRGYDKYDLAAGTAGTDTLWMRRANCSGSQVDHWHIGRGESSAPAKRVCAGCPVRVPCLDYALTTRQEWGIWGGLTEDERERLRKRASA
jgi:WhiB family redox-sensing transcriptional regulator